MTDSTADHDKGISAPTAGVSEIHEHEYRRYKLVALSGEEIERTANEICAGSTLLKNRDLWVANFTQTMAEVVDWCIQRREAIRLAFVDVRSTKVLFYFVPESDRYDLRLGALMTDLEVKLGGSAGIGSVETLQVPERSLSRFIGERAILFWNKETTQH